MSGERPGGTWWTLEPNDEVLAGALGGSDAATSEACRRGLGPELVRALREQIATPAAPVSPVEGERRVEYMVLRRSDVDALCEEHALDDDPFWRPVPLPSALALLDEALRLCVANIEETGEWGIEALHKTRSALSLAAPAPLPVDSEERPDTAPAMHIIRRADGEDMDGEFTFYKAADEGDWEYAENRDHDDDTVYEILACYPVARRKILCSERCQTCWGDDENCAACAGTGTQEAPDPESIPLPFDAHPAASAAPGGQDGRAVQRPIDPDDGSCNECGGGNGAEEKHADWCPWGVELPADLPKGIACGECGNITATAEHIDRLARYIARNNDPAHARLPVDRMSLQAARASLQLIHEDTEGFDGAETAMGRLLHKVHGEADRGLSSLPAASATPADEAGTLFLCAEDRYSLWALVAGIVGNTYGFDGESGRGLLLAQIHADAERALEYLRSTSDV